MGAQTVDWTRRLRARCLAAPGRLAFSESDDERIIEVADRLLAEGSVQSVTMMSDRERTLATSRQAGVDLLRHGARLIWATPIAASPSDDAAPTPLKAALALAADLLAADTVDAVLAGNTATTADVIRAAIAGVGLAPGVRTVSGAFLMNRPSDDRRYLFADCGVVIAPTQRQHVDIGVESVRTWRQLCPQAPPVVAYLSFATKGSAVHETAQRIANAATSFASQCPDVSSDGELQFDAAFDAAIGRRKAPESTVPGRANIFIFPDLGAGNIAYKIAQRLGGFEAYGPILQGLAKPFSDLSRGATVADICASAYINLLRCRIY